MAKIIKLHALGLLVWGLCLTAVAQVSPPEQRLVGSWELQERSDDGMGTTYEFRADSSLVITTGVMVDFDARVQAEELVGTIPVQRGAAHQIRMRVDGGSMTYVQDRDAPQKWTRLHKAIPGRPAFAGLWAVDQSAPLKKKQKNDELAQLLRDNTRLLITPAPAVPSGASGAEATGWKVRMRCPIENSGGSYTVQGSKLIMQYGGKVWVAAFRFDGNTLHILRQGDNVETVFDRFD